MLRGSSFISTFSLFAFLCCILPKLSKPVALYTRPIVHCVLWFLTHQDVLRERELLSLREVDGKCYVVPVIGVNTLLVAR